MKKKQSELKIIEISIKTEKDIENLFSDGFLSENLNKRIGNKIEFISFKRNIEERLVSPISRFIYYPKFSPNPFENKIKCEIANSKIFKESTIELNVVSTKHNFADYHYNIAYDWLIKHLKLRRCDQCRFHYSTGFDEPVFCRLSKKYGKPQFPKMDYAETCNSYKRSNIFLNSVNDIHKILKITNEQTNKENYYVIIAGSNEFENYTLFEDKCNHLLSEKIKTHNIIIISGTSYRTTKFINSYSYKHNIIRVPFNDKWGRYGQSAGNISNEEMINYADALIAFWDGKSTFTSNLIDLAKAKGIKTVVIRI